MADFDEMEEGGGGGSKLKPMIFFAAFFIISFLIIFSTLYIIFRGFQSPITFEEPVPDSLLAANDSTLVDSLAQDSLLLAPSDSLEEDTTFMSIGMDSVRKLLRKWNKEVNVEKQDKLKQSQEISEIKQELAKLKEEKKKADIINEQQIKQLAKVYEAMRPESAAEILKELDNEMVVSIIQKIKQRQAAKIMAALPPERAAKLSKLLGKK